MVSRHYSLHVNFFISDYVLEGSEGTPFAGLFPLSNSLCIYTFNFGSPYFRSNLTRSILQVDITMEKSSFLQNIHLNLRESGILISVGYGIGFKFL